MLTSPRCQKIVVSLICVGLCVSQSPLYATLPAASGPVAPGDTALPSSANRATDIALGAQGILTGRVVDASGNALAAAPLVIRYGDHEVARAVTMGDGSFSVANLRGGVHQVVVGPHQAALRLWSKETAPPSARDQLLVVAGDNVVRGNLGPAGLGVLGATTGIAIAALIVALDNKSDMDHMETQIEALASGS